MLKLDPKNTELLSQKQSVLKENIAQTSEKLKQLKEAQKLYIESGGDLNSGKYRNLQREIINTDNKLKQLKLEASNWTKASQALSELSNKMKKIGSSVSGLGKKLSTTVTAPIAGLMTAGVKYNAEIEKYKTALKTLTGSSEEANRVIEQIKKDAAATPFDVAGLTQANQLLISTGLSADDSRETILALGNAVSATGGGNDELSRMAVNLQQIKNVGKASALDIKQFAYAGIDVYGLLADYLGTTKEEASKMTITWDDLNGALIAASQEGGKYFGSMTEQSTTFNGRLSNLKESFSNFTGQLAETLMPTLESLMSKVTEFMNKFQQLSPQQQEIITKVLFITAAVGPLLIIIGKLITAGGAIAGLFSHISSLIAGLTTGTGALSGALTFLTGPVGIVIAVIGALIAVFAHLYRTNEEFRNKVQEIWAGIQELYENSIKPMIESLKQLIETAIQNIIKIIQTIWEFLEPYITQMLTWVLDFWNKYGKAIFQNISNVIKGIIDIIKAIWDKAIGPLISWLSDKLMPVFTTVFSVIGNVVKVLGDTIGSVFSSITGIFSVIIDFIAGVFTGDWKRAWEGIKNIFKNIVSGFGAIIKAPINAIIGIINGFIDGINKVQVPDWVPGVGGKGINIPHIPYLAKGGIVDKATLAMIGEGKAAEAVIPLDRTLTKYMAEAMKQAGGTGNITVNFYPQQMTEAEMDRAFTYIDRRFGLAY